MSPIIKIADRRIGIGQPCFVIAEAGVNHNGDLGLAKNLIDAAASAGADAVKFQTFNADRLASLVAPQAPYQRAATGKAESQHEMLRRLELTPEDHRELMQHCSERGIIFLSTPFEEQSADLLEHLNVPAFKIPSGEMTNLPFLAHVARLGRPMFVSTGMCSLGEVEEAVRAIESSGNQRYALLHCVSNYPADPADVNLRAMLTMQSAFQVPVGYSDHTLGTDVATAAVALGACVLEKHFTLDCSLPGPDHRASLEPTQLKALVDAVRLVESALGSGRKMAVANEADVSAVARKSLVAAKNIQAGEIFTEQVVAIKRPGNGLPPNMKPFLLARRARVNITAGQLLKLEDVA